MVATENVLLANGRYASHWNAVLFHHISTDTFLPAVVSTTDFKANLMSKFYCCVMENITASMVNFSPLQEFAGKHPSGYVECLVWT